MSSYQVASQLWKLSLKQTVNGEQESIISEGGIEEIFPWGSTFVNTW